jgi:hypothetical protein
MQKHLTNKNICANVTGVQEGEGPRTCFGGRVPAYILGLFFGTDATQVLRQGAVQIGGRLLSRKLPSHK